MSKGNNKWRMITCLTVAISYLAGRYIYEEFVKDKYLIKNKKDSKSNTSIGIVALEILTDIALIILILQITK